MTMQDAIIPVVKNTDQLVEDRQHGPLAILVVADVEQRGFCPTP